MTDEKQAARKAAFQRRRAAHGAGLDAAAQDALAAFLAPYSGKTLAGYIPIRTEINPLPVMAAWPSTVCVPVVQGAGEPLLFHAWTSATRMIAGAFGTDVPETGVEVEPEVLIVPLVSFDGNGFRLGYGGGFYDRTLDNLRARGQVLAIGFAYGVQEAEDLPVDATDQRLDVVVTESGARIFT